MAYYIDNIKLAYPTYFGNNSDNYLFGSVKWEWLVVYEKISGSTDLKIVKIFKKLDAVKTMESLKEIKENYSVGQILKNNSFSSKIEEAFYLGIDRVQNYYGPYYAWYEDGSIKLEGTCAGGKRDGVWKGYLDDETLILESEYTNGVRSGIWTDYHNTGNKYTQCEFKSGLKQGILSMWHETGELYKEVTFENDIQTNEVSYKLDKCTGACKLCEMMGLV